MEIARTIALKFLVVSLIAVFISPVAFAGSERTLVPRVAYLEPANDSVVDLSGKDTLVFRWKSQPVPGGGRVGFRFKVFKGFSYDMVVKEELKRDVFSVAVPVDKFEDGGLYSWQVLQRDGRNMLWSLADTWSFRVKKK